MIVGTWRSTHIIFHLVNRPLVLSKTTPQDYMIEQTYHLAPYLGPFGAYVEPLLAFLNFVFRYHSEKLRNFFFNFFKKLKNK